MLNSNQKINKEQFLAIKSEITDDGITISIKGKNYKIQYPKEIWSEYPETNKEILLDNLTFMQTCHLPASNQKKGAVYSTGLPIFKTFAFESTMYDLPSTAVVDNKKTTDYIRSFFNSEFLFASYDTIVPEPIKKKKNGTRKKPSAIILFTAGKESLLTLAMCLELGIKPIPIYLNEDPGHPESAHKENIIKTLEEEYGINVHKIISEPGKLRYCDLGESDNNYGSGTQFITYLLEILPFAHYYEADYVFFGNEYSCDDIIYDDEGFKSNFCFDQSSAWTKHLNIIAKVMNSNLTVASLVGPLYEIGLVKILHERYPQLAKLQMSCFSDTPEGKEKLWCSNCSKCARLFIFFKANGINTEKLGFTNMLETENKKHFALFGTECSYSYDISGLGQEEQGLAFYMAANRGEKGALIDEFVKNPAYDEIKSNFKKIHKKYFSQYDSIAMPYELKERVIDIFDESFQGKFTPKDFRLKTVKEADQIPQNTELLEEKEQ